MNDSIKVVHKDYYWECGDGCCSEYGTDSTFFYDGQEIEIRGMDSDSNLLTFIKYYLNITFEEDWESSD